MDRIDAVRVTRGLNGHELYRILARTERVAPRLIAEIWRHESEMADAGFESWAERMAEYGNAPARRYTPLERYMKDNPLHTCEPMPAGWGQEWDDVPF